MADLPLTCPWCGRENDTHAGATPDAQPEPGAVSLCWLCGNLAMYDRSPLGPLTMRRPTDVEMRDILADDSVRAALAAHSGGGAPSRVIENFRRNLPPE